jgi:hypothetical protein
MQNISKANSEFSATLILAFGLFGKKKQSDEGDVEEPVEIVIDKDHDHFDLIKDERYEPNNSGLELLGAKVCAQTISFRLQVLSSFVELKRLEEDGKYAKLLMANGLTGRRMFKSREFYLYTVRPSNKISHYSFRVRLFYTDDQEANQCQDIYFRKKDDHFEHYMSHPVVR